MKKKKIRKLKARNEYLERDQRVVRIEHEDDLEKLITAWTKAETSAKKWKRIAKMEWRLRSNAIIEKEFLNNQTICYRTKVKEAISLLQEAINYHDSETNHRT